MKKRFLRFTAVCVLAVFVVTNTGCAYILKPEQRGNKQGNIDVTNLVFDCLWLFAGVVPGVIALAVDFGSGAIYTGGGKRVSYLVSDEGRIDVHLSTKMPAGSWDLRLVTPDGKIVASEGVTLEENRDSEIRLGIDMENATGDARKFHNSKTDWALQLVSESGAKQSFPLQVKSI